MEAASGFEPLNRGLQTSALATWLRRHISHQGPNRTRAPASKQWSGKRDSNPRPQPWQGCALPLSYSRNRVYRPQIVHRFPSTRRSVTNGQPECQLTWAWVLLVYENVTP